MSHAYSVYMLQRCVVRGISIVIDVRNAAASACVLLLLCVVALSIGAAPPTREAVLAETLRPYEGPSERGVDISTLTGKVMCGYQGWFNCEGDGAERGWVHWVKSRGPLAPGNAKVDFWPDVSELSADDRFDTGFHHADGRIAQVFSSYKKATVLRHFQWMRDYGIDGAFVQRFASGVRSPDFQRHSNTVLAHCREGANRFGRAYALMYDLSGMAGDRMDDVIEDWRLLRARMKLCDDPAYLRHRGKPLVAVWGIGFNDKRRYSVADCRRLIEFLKGDGCTVMLGIPTYWREQKNDAVPDPTLHEVMALADVLSPWTIGRYHTPDEAARHAEKLITPDMAWCAGRGIDYLPVIFPGFSWHNMYGAALNSIPRLRGEFFWTQFRETKRAGASMLYVAMFDEVDEGTAIFKCAGDVPPQGGSEFVGLEGLPGDYYLRVTGSGARMLRGEIPVTDPLPPAK